MSALSPLVLDAAVRTLLDLPAPGDTIGEGAPLASLQRRQEVRDDAYQATIAARLAALMLTAAQTQQTAVAGRRGR